MYVRAFVRVRACVRSRNVTDDRSLQVAIGLMDKFFPPSDFYRHNRGGIPSTFCERVPEGGGGE